MSELIYILMVVFVGYVAYTVLTDKNGSNGETHVQSPMSPVEAPESTEASKPVEIAELTKAVAADPSAQAEAHTADELKNPKTGEVSKIPNNYRFGKRWIKEALVAEGLLDRVYKNNEVNDAISVKAQAAMSALKNIDKYRV